MRNAKSRLGRNCTSLDAGFFTDALVVIRHSPFAIPSAVLLQRGEFVLDVAATGGRDGRGGGFGRGRSAGAIGLQRGQLVLDAQVAIERGEVVVVVQVGHL